VRIRNPPRAGVKPLAFVPRALLTLAADLCVRRASAYGPHESADAVSRFKYVEIVAQPEELVSEGQARDTCAEHEYFRVARAAGERRTYAGRGCHQIPRGERGHHQ
jgi:hypothetical protein